MHEFFSILIGSIFVGNIVLTQFLGLCPFYGISKKWGNSNDFALASMIVLSVSILISYAMYTWVLLPLQLDYLALIIMLLLTLVLVQLLDKALARLFPKLHSITKSYTALFVMNSLSLGTSLVVIQVNFSFLEVLGYALGAPLGLGLVVVLFSAMHERILLHQRVPKPFQGAAIAFIMTALMAMAFMAFTGIV